MQEDEAVTYDRELTIRYWVEFLRITAATLRNQGFMEAALYVRTAALAFKDKLH